MGYIPPEDFGQQWAGTPLKSYRPDSPYRRYVWDLYGTPGYDWMPFLNSALVCAMVALVIAVGAFLGGIA